MYNMRNPRHATTSSYLETGACAPQVVQWFVQRAVEVDNRSGQLASAAALLRLCSKANAPQALTDALEAVNSLRDVAQSGVAPQVDRQGLRTV